MVNQHFILIVAEEMGRDKDQNDFDKCHYYGQMLVRAPRKWQGLWCAHDKP